MSKEYKKMTKDELIAMLVEKDGILSGANKCTHKDILAEVTRVASIAIATLQRAAPTAMSNIKQADAIIKNAIKILEQEEEE